MKKTYIIPQTTVVRMNAESMLAASDPTIGTNGDVTLNPGESYSEEMDSQWGSAWEE